MIYGYASRMTTTRKAVIIVDLKGEENEKRK